MKRAIVVMTLVGTLIAPAAAEAQSPDVAALTARCETLEDATDKATCLYVVGRFLDPSATPVTGEDYGTGFPSLGVTQVGELTDITLEKVDWDVNPSFGDPADGNRYVAIEVLYEATADDASYNPYDWSMVDFDGYSWDRAIGGKEPDLQSSNAFPLGRKARGWVTFEVPKDVGSFEVAADSGRGRYLRWRIDEP